MPSTAFSGVRISCDMFERNSPLMRMAWAEKEESVHFDQHRPYCVLSCVPRCPCLSCWCLTFSAWSIATWSVSSSDVRWASSW